jgi:hypothetical protein
MCRFGSATAPHHRRCDRDRADDDHRCAAIIESALVAEVSRIVPYRLDHPPVAVREQEETARSDGGGQRVGWRAQAFNVMRAAIFSPVPGIAVLPRADLHDQPARGR